ncbi:DUF6233 domain-containing protein [Streptomyces sp. NPDC048370]|uniref:DUF6233 domain-containing protein n=1 Tax=Streptomyces sp. NPDC048370 TaxID=3365540 RepID=UPI0037166520
MSYLRVGGRPIADSSTSATAPSPDPKKAAPRPDQAREALTVGGIRACEVCRPDSLGILD